jgi:hypothetical protein
MAFIRFAQSAEARAPYRLKRATPDVYLPGPFDFSAWDDFSSCSSSWLHTPLPSSSSYFCTRTVSHR